MKNPERLHLLDPFSHFGARELTLLSEAVSEEGFTAGAQVFKEDDPAGDLYLLEKGEIRVRKMTPFGEYELFRPLTGDLFGEDSFLTGIPRDGDADVIIDSELLVMNAQALASASDQDSRFELALHWALWRGLSKKLRLANDRLTSIFSGDSELPELPPRTEQSLGAETHLDMAHKVGLFREQRLSAMEINFLASLSREEVFPPGKTIFKEGEPGEKMYIVADGTVMISKLIAGVGEEALAFLERGDYFGEMALIDRRPRSADARAHPDKGVTVLALPRAVVEGLLNIEKVSSVRLLKILTSLAGKRTRAIQNKLVGLFLLAGGDIEAAPP
ncbi:MAG: cyclic nucleotide-binding domain-containing protein [bacterium]|nr:cyclic nucleotide-binding domain-containing protein [bacterium]